MESRKEIFRGGMTNEKLGKKFVSLFDLVNYAIRLAENMIGTGRDPRVKVESQSRAIQVLGEIATGRDHLDEIVIREEPALSERFSTAQSFNDDEAPLKKKGRKSLLDS